MTVACTAPPNDSGLSSMGVGSNWTICELSTRTAVSASRQSRLMTEADAAAVRSAILGIRR